MRTATREGVIKGVKASRSGTRVSHLLFADDCLLFEEASSKGVSALKQILREYRNNSGQCENFDKSTVFFSSNLSEEVRQMVVTQFRIRSSNEFERYLGPPTLVGRRKKESFQALRTE